MQIQKVQNTSFAFGLKPISPEDAIKIGEEFYRYPFGNPGGEIVKFMDTPDEFALALDGVFRLGAEKLSCSDLKLDFVTKVISNIVALSSSCKKSVLAAFPRFAETGVTTKLFENSTIDFMDDITRTLSRVFGRNSEKLSSSSRAPSIFSN